MFGGGQLLSLCSSLFSCPDAAAAAVVTNPYVLDLRHAG